MLGNPQPSTPPLQAGCASDLALSPKVRPPAEPVPIWAYNITLSSSPYLYTERLCNDCVSETIDAINTQPMCPWGRWEGKNLIFMKGNFAKNTKNAKGRRMRWRRTRRWWMTEDVIWYVMTLVNYSAMTHHCKDVRITQHSLAQTPIGAFGSTSTSDFVFRNLYAHPIVVSLFYRLFRKVYDEGICLLLSRRGLRVFSPEIEIVRDCQLSPAMMWGTPSKSLKSIVGFGGWYSVCDFPDYWRTILIPWRIMLSIFRNQDSEYEIASAVYNDNRCRDKRDDVRIEIVDRGDRYEDRDEQLPQLMTSLYCYNSECYDGILGLLIVYEYLIGKYT
jgi:hypothetical protein